MFLLFVEIKFNAWTTSGQCVQDNEINVSIFTGLLIDSTFESCSPSSFLPNPASPRIARIKLLNSCPPGIPEKLIPVFSPSFKIVKDIGRVIFAFSKSVLSFSNDFFI